MRVKGAKGTDEQAQAAAKYLSTYFAAVDVNKATAEELVKVAEFTPDEAAAMVAWRDAGHASSRYTEHEEGAGARRQAPRRGQAAGWPTHRNKELPPEGGSYCDLRSVRTTLPTGFPSRLTTARIR